MTGEFLHTVDPPHHCEPPAFIGFGFRTYEQPGTIWLCECGQHWVATRDYRPGHAAPCIWSAVSARRARRILTRGGKRKGLMP